MGFRSRLIDLLDTQGVAYETHVAAPGRHPLARMPGECSIHVLMVEDRSPAMFVVPADAQLDLNAVRRLVGHDVRPATEGELSDIFHDCEPGAWPAFGNWYGMPVYFDSELAAQRQVSFPAGVQGEQVTLPALVLQRLTRGILAPLGGRASAIPA